MVKCIGLFFKRHIHFAISRLLSRLCRYFYRDIWFKKTTKLFSKNISIEQSEIDIYIIRCYYLIMKLDTIISLYQFEILAQRHIDRFNDYEQNFLVSMISCHAADTPVSAKQMDYCRVLVNRMIVYERLKSRR